MKKLALALLASLALSTGAQALETGVAPKDAALQFHHFRADPAVLRVLIEESTRTIDEIIDMGVELRGIRTMYPKEESLMCWHLVNPLRPIIASLPFTGKDCLGTDSEQAQKSAFTWNAAPRKPELGCPGCV